MFVFGRREGMRTGNKIKKKNSDLCNNNIYSNIVAINALAAKFIFVLLPFQI